MTTQLDNEVGGNTISPTNKLTLTKNKVKIFSKEQIVYDPKVRSKSWLLTCNNPTLIDTLPLNNIDVRYIVWQFEVGKQGTRHYHALLYFENARSFKSIKDKFKRCRIEKPRNVDDCIKYCKKDKTRVEGPFERGEPPKQGSRTDLLGVADAIKDKKPLDQIFTEFPSQTLKYIKNIKEVKGIMQSHRNAQNKPKILWLWGLAGVGKTFSVTEYFESVYIKDGTQWWDNYDQQQCILIDDFDGKWPFRDLLRLLDRNQYQAQVKGGYVKINSPYIIITCEFPPDHWWQDNDYAQIKRRIDKIITAKCPAVYSLLINNICKLHDYHTLKKYETKITIHKSTAKFNNNIVISVMDKIKNLPIVNEDEEEMLEPDG